MALTGSTIASTYLKLLRVNTDTMGADATASYIQDSADTDSALSISTTRVGIGTAAPVNALHLYQDSSDVGSGAGITIEQDGVGDPQIQFLTTGVQRWVAGIDNSDSDSFKISSDGDLNTNARLTIDTSGNVGIGTASPQSALHVGAGADSPDIDSVALFSHTGTTNVAVRDASNNVELMNYAYSGGGLVGTVTNHDFSIRTNNANRVTISNAGDVTFTGDLIMADGKGINFAAMTTPADAAGMDAETLTDYEEGEYTPTIVGGTSGNFVLNGTNDVFRYTKIGRLVHIQGLLVIASDNSTSGQLRVSLPFTSGDSNGLCGRSYGSCIVYDHGGTIDGTVVTGLEEASAFFTLLEIEDNGTRNFLDESDVDGAWALGVDFCYSV